MSNLIPDASERAAFEALFVTISESAANPRLFERVLDDRRYCSMEVEYAWLTYRSARAAAQVGAIGAADIPTWAERRDNDIKVSGEALADPYVYMNAEIADLRARLAAGAQAETPKPVARMERFPKDQEASKVLGSLRPAWLGSTPAEGTLLYAGVPTPAATIGAGEGKDALLAELCALLPGPYYMDLPDGGDTPVVEQIGRMAKDAARYREIRDLGATFYINDKKFHVCEWAMDDALDKTIAAMRSKTSPGEAG